jgi:hypothetical protein
MTHNAQKYEVYVESVTGLVNDGLMLTNWSWRRMDKSGSILVHGSIHGSLESCFASVRRHSARFGEAPVKINLQDSRHH